MAERAGQAAAALQPLEEDDLAGLLQRFEAGLVPDALGSRGLRSSCIMRLTGRQLMALAMFSAPIVAVLVWPDHSSWLRIVGGAFSTVLWAFLGAGCIVSILLRDMSDSDTGAAALPFMVAGFAVCAILLWVCMWAFGFLWANTLAGMCIAMCIALGFTPLV